jgi:hypothetical protein
MTPRLAKELRRMGFNVPAYAELPLDGRKPVQRVRGHGEAARVDAAEHGRISRQGIGKVLGVR